MTQQQIEDLEQAAYLRGWNDRPSSSVFAGIVIGVICGLMLALAVVLVAA